MNERIVNENQLTTAGAQKTGELGNETVPAGRCMKLGDALLIWTSVSARTAVASALQPGWEATRAKLHNYAELHTMGVA
jgi:hypothetical protein